MMEHKHEWKYFCLGMYRYCECGKTQANHINYGWVDVLFEDNEPDSLTHKVMIRKAYAIKMSNGKIERLGYARIINLPQSPT